MHARLAWIAIATALVACGGSEKSESRATTPDAAPDQGTAVACSASNLAGCDYPEAALASTEREGIEVTDAHTGRVLPILARVPAGAGPFPVVVWSHGGAFNPAGHHLGKEWGGAIAGQGYVVLHVAHVPLDADTGKAVCEAASVPSSACVPDGSDEDGALIGIVKTLDTLAVLDDLARLSKISVDRGGPALDLAHVAVAGWSAGSRAPVVLLGAKLDVAPGVPRFARPDSRVVAAVALSTTGPGFGGFFDEGAETSWTAMRGPLLIATGQNDIKPTNPTLVGELRRFPFTAQPGDGTRRLLYSNLPVGVGAHGTFNLEDATSSDERLVRLSRALRSSVLAFLDAHVKGDEAAKSWLATGNAKTLAGDADWEQR